jgi:hypothetical protein
LIFPHPGLYWIYGNKDDDDDDDDIHQDLNITIYFEDIVHDGRILFKIAFKT